MAHIPPPDPTLPEFLAYVTRTYDKATKHKGTSTLVKDRNDVAMQWLRHPEYTGIQWVKLIGDIDWHWLFEVAPAEITETPRFPVTFPDPATGAELRVRHLFAAISGVVRKGPIPDQRNKSKTGVADFAGWGGDLVTLYGEWQKDYVESPNGYLWARINFATDLTTFPMEDLILDADGYHIGIWALAEPNTPLPEIMSAYYSTTPTSTVPGRHCKTRLRDFYNGRFRAQTGGQSDDVFLDACSHQIASWDDLLVASFRSLLIIYHRGFNSEPELTVSARRDFYRGIRDRLKNLIDDEAARQ